MSNTHLTITIDGPVASGKTAVGKEVSKILKIRFLDTGIMFWALCVAAIKESIDPTNNFLDVAIITAPEKRSKKTIEKLNTVAGRVLNK